MEKLWDVSGDSIVVAPSQTLSNEEYHMLRETALRVCCFSHINSNISFTKKNLPLCRLTTPLKKIGGGGWASITDGKLCESMY